MVLISGLQRDTFAAAHLSDGFLQAVADPDIGRTDKRHQTEPECCVVDRTSPVVSVCGKQTSNCDAPLDSLERLVEAEHRLQLEAVILARLVIWVVVKEVLLRRLILTDVSAAELVDAFHFL